MKNRIKKVIVKYWLLLFLLLIFIYLSISKISFSEIYGIIISLHAWQIAILILIFFSISLLNIFSRKYLIFALGHFSSYKNLILIHFASIAAHYSTPAKIGFPLSVYLLNKNENIPYPTGTALILVELTINMIVCGLFAIVGSLYYFNEHIKLTTKYFIGFIILGIFVFTLANFLINKFSEQNKIVSSIRNVLKSISLMNSRQILIYSIIICITQIFSSVGLFVLCHFFLVDINYFQTIAASKTAFFIGAITMVPLGLGVREGSMLFFLNHFGVEHAVSLSIVSIQRLLSTGLSFILGMIAAAFLGIKQIRAVNGK